MSEAVDRLRQDPQALEGALRMAGADVSDPKKIKCPWHDDSKASAHTFQPENGGGVWKFRCFACNMTLDYFDVLSKVKGRPAQELMAEAAKESPSGPREGRGATETRPEAPKRQVESLSAIDAMFSGRLAAKYAYTNPDNGKIDLLVLRTTDKQFIQLHQTDPKGPFFFGACPKPLPLYNRTRLRAAETVIVVEGEKDVHTLTRLGHVATTSPAGSSNAENADWSPLAGKRVILWPDNDDPGRKYAATVRRMLEALPDPPRVMLIDPNELGIPAKQDATWLATQDDYTEQEQAGVIAMALESAKSLGASSEVFERLDAIISGRRVAIPIIHRQTSTLTQAFLPQTITIVCGSPGASKTFWAQEILMEMHFQGVKVALLHIEDDRAYHLRRALAQLAHRSEITDEAWVKNNAQSALDLEMTFRENLDSFGSCITDIPGQTITYDQALAWCRARSEAGCRVIAMDPITLADPGNRKPWEADRFLMSGLKAISVEYKNSIMLVTHPGKGSAKDVNPLDRMAGGAAFQRAAQCVVWLEHHVNPIDSKLITPMGTFRTTGDMPLNRTLKLLKTRNGRGQGLNIGYHFNPRTLRSTELGIMEEEQKRKR